MVAVRAHEADRFAAGPPEGVRMFLVYGNDAGAITETARLLERVALQRGGGDRVTRFGSDELSGAPGIMADEAYSASLFGGEPVLSLRVLDGRHNVIGALKPMLDQPPAAAWIIVEAGELASTSALRKAFEAARAAAAIPAYHAEGADLAALVHSAAGDAGLLVEPAAMEMLTGLLGGDRLTSRSELEKLFLYARDSGVVGAADVQAVVGDAAEAKSDDVLDAVLLGDFERAETGFTRYLSDGGSPAALIAQLLRYLLQLSTWRAEVDGGRSVGSALDKARPPVFSRRRSTVEAQVKLWSGSALAAARQAIFDAVAATRKQPALDAALVSDALQQLAVLAGRQKRGPT